MPTHVALLRGVNVGGSSRVSMAALREVVTSLGHRDVSTYIQSGNVVFSTGSVDTHGLAAELESAIDSALNVRSRGVVLSRDELARVVADNPYADEPDPRFVHAVLRGDDPGPQAAADLAAALEKAAAKGSADEACLVGRTLYLRTPNGFGRSELAAQLSRPVKAGAPVPAATARNWATVTRLLAMLDG